MQKTPVRVAFTCFVVALAVQFGCSESKEDDGPELPPRNLDEKPSCENREPVDDRPACDECVRSKCCEYVVACDKTPTCKQIQECLDECTDPSDFTCPLLCSSSNPGGSQVLQDVGACAQTECKSECPSTNQFDAGIDPF